MKWEPTSSAMGAFSRGSRTPLQPPAGLRRRNDVGLDHGARDLGKDALQLAHVLFHDQIREDAFKLADVLLEDMQTIALAHARKTPEAQLGSCGHASATCKGRELRIAKAGADRQHRPMFDPAEFG
jgi:hypothetical protein